MHAFKCLHSMLTHAINNWTKIKKLKLYRATFNITCPQCVRILQTDAADRLKLDIKILIIYDWPAVSAT